MPDDDDDEPGQDYDHTRLSDMTKDDLIAFATEKNLTVDSSLSKDELIESIYRQGKTLVNDETEPNDYSIIGGAGNISARFILDGNVSKADFIGYLGLFENDKFIGSYLVESNQAVGDALINNTRSTIVRGIQSITVTTEGFLSREDLDSKYDFSQHQVNSYVIKQI